MKECINRTREGVLKIKCKKTQKIKGNKYKGISTRPIYLLSLFDKHNKECTDIKCNSTGQDKCYNAIIVRGFELLFAETCTSSKPL